ncbi:MAG: DUF2335 domain-containing protein [bacterium]|nr:DUF2335 domain-containing protein [bacterium]
MHEDANKPQQNSNSDKQALIFAQKAEMFSGPIPQPEIIEKYEKILPGAAKEIFGNWGKQVTHRHHIEKVVVWSDSIKSVGGLILGFIVVMGAIGGGVYTALKGQILFGGGLSLAGLAMLATAFISNRKAKQQ